jgi:hypothetical protein
MPTNLMALTETIAFCIKNHIAFPDDLLRDLHSIGALKTYDYYLRVLSRLVETLYSGAIGGEFVGIMENLVLGQISNAYETAWIDSGFELPPDNYIRDASQSRVLDQQVYIQDYYQAIVDAKIDKTSISPLLARAEQWANNWTAAYNDGILLIGIELGEKMQWHEGDTVDKCSTCVALDGIVMFAREWDTLGVHPQGYPNALLECGGGGPGNHCGCTLTPTDRRRSPGAFETVMNIVNK